MTYLKDNDNLYMIARNSRNFLMGSTDQLMISRYMLVYTGPNSWSSTSQWYTLKQKFNAFKESKGSLDSKDTMGVIILVEEEVEEDMED